MSGTVYLVGAGPGDPELLTVKARRLIDRADVVMYDSLTGEGVVDSVPATATAVDVGKRPDGTRTDQEEINRLMVEHARAGRAVVRLKGGDPTVFGRGGEEAEHLAEEEVDFEVVPGVTSVLTPGAVGIPLTHREHASSVTVVTGHEDPTKEESAIDWGALARTVEAGGTLLILMGVRRLGENVRALRGNGVPAETPAAMIEKATWPGETTVTGTLDTIVEDADAAGIEPPAITVVGDVVAVRDRVSEYLRRAPAAGAPTAETIRRGPPLAPGALTDHD